MNTQLQLEKIQNDLNNYKVAIDTHSIVAITDPQGVITYVNQKFCHISQYSQAELLGRTHKIINSSYHPSSFFLDIWQTIARGDIWKGEICNRTKHGDLYWVDTTIVPLKDSHGVLKNYISIQTDITQLKKAENQARYLALYDELTGLPNRRFMQEQLMTMMQSRQLNRKYSALMILDLDNFKNINDTLGHACGDELLKMVAVRLKQCITAPNCVVRLGGDEFLILLPALSSVEQQAHEQALHMADQVRQNLNYAFIFQDRMLQTSASIGVYLFSNAELNSSEALKRTDMALYEAKISGKNCISVFDPSLEQRVLKQNYLLSDLRMALHRNEFQIYYQAITDQKQCVVGYESLLRWQHPKHGVIMPADFITLAEQNGLMHDIGQKVLTLACQQLKRWSHNIDSAAWTLSVNISVVQFQHPDFDTCIIQILKETGINPARLRLELTESLFYADLPLAIEKMQNLIRHGLRFSMDDFGTGYSSLNYLKMLPLDQLKIDRSFVEYITDRPRDLAIVRTIIDLAKILEMNVVVEGIESKAQFEVLKANGCDLFQGYFLGRPQKMIS